MHSMSHQLSDSYLVQTFSGSSCVEMNQLLSLHCAWFPISA